MSRNTTMNGMIGFESRTDMFKAIEMLRENGYIKEENNMLLWDSENDGGEPIRVVEDGYLSLYGASPRNIQVNIEEIVKKLPSFFRYLDQGLFYGWFGLCFCL